MRIGQIRAVLSSLPVTSRLPSVLIATAVTGPECPARTRAVLSGSAAERSQSRRCCPHSRSPAACRRG